MSLVSRLAFPETIGDMFQASHARFDEGVALIEAGYLDGGIYLLGYTAEMILKIAFCRVDSTVPHMTTVRSKFPDAVRLWRSLFGTQLPSGYEHDLIFWETVLPLARTEQSKAALGIMVSQTPSECIRSINGNWDVKMRYQPRMASAAEADEVRVAVAWMFNNQSTLWS